MAPEVVSEGFLLKRSATLAFNWNKRYFSVTNETLTYAEDRSSPRKKTYNLAECSHVEVDGPLKINLKFEERSFILKADTTAERDAWVESIRRAHKVAYDNSPRQTRANTLARVMQHYGALDHYVPSTEQLI